MLIFFYFAPYITTVGRLDPLCLWASYGIHWLFCKCWGWRTACNSWNHINDKLWKEHPDLWNKDEKQHKVSGKVTPRLVRHDKREDVRRDAQVKVQPWKQQGGRSCCIWNEGLGEAGGGVGFAFHQQLSHSCTRKEENPKISLKNLSSPLWGLCLFLTKAIRNYILFFIPKQQYKALHKCLDKCLLVLQS